MVENKIGKQIQFHRKKIGLTQEQLAEKVALSTNYLSAVERGIYSLSLDKLVDIINCIGCSADDIFADVINSGYKIKASRFSDEMAKLSPNEQKKIFDVIEIMIKAAKSK